MIKLFSIVFILFGFLNAQSSMPAVADTVLNKDSQTFYVGNKAVEVVVYQKTGDNIVYFNMHDNENTSVQSGLEILKRFGGTLIEFKHGGDRNLTFTVEGSTFTFDPNRMFTDVGAEKSIKAQSNNRFSPLALETVRNFAKEVIAYLNLDSAQVVVALHNNTDENYNIRDYLRGGSYQDDVLETQFVRGSDADDFYYVTEQRFYDALAAAQKNVTLQNNANTTDDGSFSVYCGLNNIPYINVEAEHGHYSSQIVLMEVLREVLMATN